MTGLQQVAGQGMELLGQQGSTVKKPGVFHLAQGSATSAGSANNNTKDAAEITGSDFLTLLVSELKNQDPTKPTDPQEYVQQLVGVNSLQQLIAINKDLGGV